MKLGGDSGGAMAKNPPSDAGEGLIPGQGSKIPNTSGN